MVPTVLSPVMLHCGDISIDIYRDSRQWWLLGNILYMWIFFNGQSLLDHVTSWYENILTKSAKTDKQSEQFLSTECVCASLMVTMWSRARQNIGCTGARRDYLTPLCVYVTIIFLLDHYLIVGYLWLTQGYGNKITSWSQRHIKLSCTVVVLWFPLLVVQYISKHAAQRVSQMCY